jgi:HAD superfamily phosphoserine phosphatase-like hydrolase
LLIELVEVCIRDGIFRPSVARIYGREKKEWLDREGSYEEYIAGVVEAFLGNLKGVRYLDFRRASDEVIAAHRSRVYRFSRDLVKALKLKNYYLVAISHSPKEIVETFAKGLGFDKVYGIVYELDSKKKKFSGSIRHKEIIFDKAKIVRRVLEKEQVTLRGSVGVGDTESDISFLRLVDRPICFNPNQKLFVAARRHGWEIVVERKDVIYKINK